MTNTPARPPWYNVPQRLKRWRDQTPEHWLVRITPALTLVGIVSTALVAALGIPGPIDGLICNYGRTIEHPDVTLKVAAGLAAAFLAVAALGRYELNRAQNRHAEQQLEQARQQVEIADRQQITERFTRAVDQLGNPDNRAIRLGGIYGLEHIANDAPELYGQTILDVLCAYLRENRQAAPDLAQGVETEAEQLHADQQAVLTVLGRVAPQLADRRVDLNQTDVSGASLPGAHLYGANLYGADLSGANLERTNLTLAQLGGADLSGADLSGADLSETNLTKTNLYGANLYRANLYGAKLTQTNLCGAFLFKANFAKAFLNNANLSGAILEGAELSGADLTGADLTGAKWDPGQTPVWPDGFEAPENAWDADIDW